MSCAGPSCGLRAQGKRALAELLAAAPQADAARARAGPSGAGRAQSQLLPLAQRQQQQPHQQMVRLAFKPANIVLQNAHQVRAATHSSGMQARGLRDAAA